MADLPSYPVVFLEKVDSLEPLPASHIRAMDTAYGFNSNPNVEIRIRWYGIALKGPAQADFAKVYSTLRTALLYHHTNEFCYCRRQRNGLSVQSLRADLGVGLRAA